jgi:transposase
MISSNDNHLQITMLTREQILDLVQSNPQAIADKILALQNIIALFQNNIKTLEARLTELEGRLAKNSQNSSKPPASDGYKKPQPKSLRKNKGRKSGGQNGHPGKTLESSENPDKIIVIPLNQCPHCNDQSIKDQAAESHERRQVFEIPEPKFEVTEYRAEVKKCPGCGKTVHAPFPENIKARVQYGPRLLTYVVYLRHQHLLPLRRISQVCEDSFGLPVSEEVILGASATCSEKLEPFEAELIRGLQQSPVVNVDESGLQVGKKLYWLHTAGTAELTFYGVHQKRGQEATDSFGILPNFKGTLVHDFWRPYLKYDCGHGLCNAHLLRELTYLFEQEQQVWAGALLNLLTEMNKFVQSMKGRVAQLSERQKELWVQRFREIVAQGRAANPRADTQIEKGKRGRPKQSKSQNLLDRLEKYEKNVLAFLHDLEVPFTNNQAEQDIRMVRVQQKISGCYRTEAGAKHFARIRSFISTARKHGLKILASIEQALQGNCFSPTIKIS